MSKIKVTRGQNLQNISYHVNVDALDLRCSSSHTTAQMSHMSSPLMRQLILNYAGKAGDGDTAAFTAAKMTRAVR